MSPWLVMKHLWSKRPSSTIKNIGKIFSVHFTFQTAKGNVKCYSFTYKCCGNLKVDQILPTFIFTNVSAYSSVIVFVSFMKNNISILLRTSYYHRCNSHAGVRKIHLTVWSTTSCGYSIYILNPTHPLCNALSKCCMFASSCSTFLSMLYCIKCCLSPGRSSLGVSMGFVSPSCSNRSGR